MGCTSRKTETQETGYQELTLEEKSNGVYGHKLLDTHEKMVE
jgi:hypothetical protein